MKTDPQALSAFLGWIVDAQEFVPVPADAKPALDALIAEQQAEPKQAMQILTPEQIYAIACDCEPMKAMRPSFWPDSFDNLTSIRQQFYTDMAAQLNERMKEG